LIDYKEYIFLRLANQHFNAHYLKLGSAKFFYRTDTYLKAQQKNTPYMVLAGLSPLSRMKNQGQFVLQNGGNQKSLSGRP